MSINLNLLLIEGGPVRHTVGLGNSIVDRPALPVGPQAIHYSQLQPVVDTIQDKPIYGILHWLRALALKQPLVSIGMIILIMHPPGAQ